MPSGSRPSLTSLLRLRRDAVRRRSRPSGSVTGSAVGGAAPGSVVTTPSRHRGGFPVVPMAHMRVVDLPCGSHRVPPGGYRGIDGLPRRGRSHSERIGRAGRATVGRARRKGRRRRQHRVRAQRRRPPCVDPKRGSQPGGAPARSRQRAGAMCARACRGRRSDDGVVVQPAVGPVLAEPGLPARRSRRACRRARGHASGPLVPADRSAAPRGRVVAPSGPGVIAGGRRDGRSVSVKDDA